MLVLFIVQTDSAGGMYSVLPHEFLKVCIEVMLEDGSLCTDFSSSRHHPF
jgi:hypothetical protein